MIKIDNPDPRQHTPGTARIDHLFEDMVVIGAGMMAFIADRDQAQILTIDPTSNRLGQTTELSGEGYLTRLGHLTQIHRPHAFAPAVEHGDRGRGPLLPHAMAKRHKDTVTPHRKGGTKATLGRTG